MTFCIFLMIALCAYELGNVVVSLRKIATILERQDDRAKRDSENMKWPRRL